MEEIQLEIIFYIGTKEMAPLSKLPSLQMDSQIIIKI